MDTSAKGDLGDSSVGRTPRRIRTFEEKLAIIAMIAMIALPAGVKVWLAAGGTDMRKGFDGLGASCRCS